MSKSPVLLVLALLIACTADIEPIAVTRVGVTAAPPTATNIAPSPVLPTITPTVLPEVVEVATAAPAPTATLIVTTTADPPCARPEDIQMIGVAIVIDPAPCLVWQDNTNDESGFIVEFIYRPTGEAFRQELPANSQQWPLPSLLDPCNYGYWTKVTAVRTNDIGNRLIAVQEGTFTCDAPLPPEEAAQLLQNSIIWQEIDANLHILTGWTEGYRRSGSCQYGPYRWLDESHIMLFPIVGYKSFYEDPKGAQVTQPFVLDVATGRIWTADQAQTFGCELAVYSSPLAAVIEARDGLVRVRNLDGDVLQTYEGSNPLHMGETGLRLLAGDTWIDLVTSQTIILLIDEPTRLTRLAWAGQDTRFYDCCVSYGDVLNGTYYFRYGLVDIFAGGIGVGPDYSGEYVQWFGEKRYVMNEPGAINWTYQEDAEVSTSDEPFKTPLIPLIDPVNQSYINIGAELGLTQPVAGCSWVERIRPSHDQIWLFNCTDTGWLVDVPALTAQEVSGYRFVQWSPDGRYALLTANDTYTLLDPETMIFTPLPDVPASATLPVWSETADYLALTTAANDGVYVVATADGQSRFLSLQPTTFMAWRPGTDDLALALNDGTIQLISADDGTNVALTPSYPTVRDLRWSPDGAYLLFISGEDIVVRTVN